jgi:hypothetical protein
MAHWAGSGPADRSCGRCVHLIKGKDRRHRCALYERLMGRRGGEIPRATAACRYFEAADERKWAALGDATQYLLRKAYQLSTKQR